MTPKTVAGRGLLEGCVPWPEEFAERYRRKGYWRGVTIGELVDRWAERSGDAEAIICGDERVSYAQLAERSEHLARHLKALGIRRNERVVMQLPNGLEFVYLLLALLRIGALPVLALPAHREHEISYMIEHAEAVAYAVPERHRGFDHLELAREMRRRYPTMREVLIDRGDHPDAVSISALLEAPAPAGSSAEDGPRPSDVALFLLSGGTTGLPKLIPRTHDDYAYFFSTCAEVCDIGPDSTYLIVLPISHNFPLAVPGLLGVLSAGGRLIIMQDPSPEATFPVIERERVTHSGLVPVLAIRWCDSPLREKYDLSSLRLLTVGGSRLSDEAARRIRPALGCELQQALGMAEGLVTATRIGDPEEVVTQTQGRPICPDDEIRIVDENGEPVPDGEPGELEVRGPYTIRGYYKAPEHNARAFSEDGFYRTGDVVRMHPSGNLVVEGRRKDLINRGGEKISAEEIESLILSHPRIEMVAAVAMPDPEMGERTCAYVVTKDGGPLTVEELAAHLDGLKVARYKFPERVEVVPRLPLTAVGKVDKKALREDIAAKLRAEAQA